MEIRHFSSGELTGEAVARFLRECAAAYPSEVGAPDLGEWPAKLAVCADVFCTQRADGSLASALFAYLNDETKIGYMPFFCVLPDSKRPKDLAYRLHEAYRDVAAQRGLAALRLEVLKTNVHAFGFYARQGYCVIEDHADRGRWLMELTLPAATTFEKARTIV